MEKPNDFYIKTVLLVEDDHALGTLLKYRLELLGISLIHALSGSEAIEFFQTNNTPLLMIVDYELNDITGDVLIQQLRELGVQHPFIAITGAGNEEIASEFLRLGAEDYVIKDLGFLNNIENSIIRTLKTLNYKYKLQEQQKIIADNEKRYRMIFENIQDVYLVVDNRFQIIEISPSIENVLDIPSEMLINQPIYYILNNRKQWKEALKRLLEDKVLLNYEITLINRPKNKQAICQVNAKLVEFDGVKCAVISLRDITEIRQLQKQLLNIVAETEEKERRQISENIHDNIAPVFATSKMYFTRAFDESKKAEERKALYNDAIQMLDDGIQMLRNVSSELMSQVLSGFGLEKAIMRFLQQRSKINEIKLNFSFQTQQPRFEMVIENVIYRTVTELVHNGYKHSQAQNIELKINQVEKIISIIYQDDGKGFDYNNYILLNNPKGQGLQSMNNRIKMLGGIINFQQLEKGCMFKIEIPIQ